MLVVVPNEVSDLKRSDEHNCYLVEVVNESGEVLARSTDSDFPLWAEDYNENPGDLIHDTKRVYGVIDP